MRPRWLLPLAALTALATGCAADATEPRPGSDVRGAERASCDDDPARVSRAARADGATVLVVTPEGPHTADPDAPGDLDEALDRARRRAREAGDASPGFGEGTRFVVARTLSGAAPTRLVMQAPPCPAPAYLAVLAPGAAPILVPLDGVDDPRLAG